MKDARGNCYVTCEARPWVSYPRAEQACADTHEELGMAAVIRNPNYAAELRAWALDLVNLQENDDENDTPTTGRLNDDGVSLLLGWAVGDD